LGQVSPDPTDSDQTPSTSSVATVNERLKTTVENSMRGEIAWNGSPVATPAVGSGGDPMTRRKRRETPEWKWEEALIDAYHDHCWHKLLDPLYEQFKRWDAGEIDHWDLGQAIHEMHKENRHRFNRFNQNRRSLIRMIKWDEGWFDEWVADHPPPPGIELAPRLGPVQENGQDAKASSEDDDGGSRSLQGLCDDLGPAPSEEDSAEIRREM